MPLLQLDHLVVAAATLSEGIAYVEGQLGVPLQAGGKHTFMGTHNALLKLGSGVYLEVISVDPETPKPLRPRWFNLDQLKLPQPRLVHWVARTDDIDTLSQEFDFCGPVIAASRGSLHWKITIPDDGAMPYDGTFPTLIEWPQGPHVSDRMEDQGCSLAALFIQHEKADDIAKRVGQDIAGQQLYFSSGPAKLTATISTLRGQRTLS